MIEYIAGIWLGTLIAIDLIEAPTKFKIKSIERSAAIELGQAVFRKMGYVQMVLALLLVLIVALQPYHLLGLVYTALLALLALGISPWLQGNLTRCYEQQKISGKTSDLLKIFHRMYVVGDSIKMVLLVLLVVIARS